MKLSSFLSIHAVLLLGFGIAFALYGPLMLAFFAIPETLQIDALTYWHLAAFARMFGAALFGSGLLLFALRSPIKKLDHESQRGIVFALLLSNAMGLLVSLTQQTSVWQTPAGWITSAIFAALLIGYSYMIARPNSTFE
jgi:uncharacterized membrane protein